MQNGLWKVENNFNILSTTTDGTTDGRPEAIATCHTVTWIESERDHLTESVWLRKCADIDFFMSWGYIGLEDSAIMTLM